MRTAVAWTDTPPERDGVRSVCYSLAHSPDGTQLVAGVGSRVLVYNASDGDLLHSLKGHKDAVYGISYARDGKNFASGAADKTVIIWTDKAEGVLRYSHSEAIQCLAYSPRGPQLASATAGDFGLWSPEQKAVAKHRVTGKVLSMSWTNDGQFLALGQFDGCVSVRDKSGGEKVKIEAGGPCWSVRWSPETRRAEPDVLAVGCWDGTLAFYNLNGSRAGESKRLGYDPCDVSFFGEGDCVVVGGANREARLATVAGVHLAVVCEKQSWVWCARQRPGANAVAVGCEDGSVSMHTLSFGTVHGLYHDRYAYRDAMTDVVVQHLVSERRVRIKCGALVEKIAVYKDKLAVQLPDRVVLYRLLDDGTIRDPHDMQYVVATTLRRALECSLLVATSDRLILCQEKKLQLLDFDGRLEREWVFDATVRYIKVTGGPAGGEGALIGLKDGTIVKIFVDQPFPVTVVKHARGVKCLDLSRDRRRVAAVDDDGVVVVYDAETGALVYEDAKLNYDSLAWNTEFDDMLCYSGNGTLCVRTADFPAQTQSSRGFVVGFKGTKAFCLRGGSAAVVDVPQSASVAGFLEREEHDSAYAVACLGVTESDWRALGLAALDATRLDVARKSFARVRDARFLELLSRVERAARRGEAPAGAFRAEALAYQGRFQEAAKAFAKAGEAEKAMAMFSDLRQFDEAKAWAAEHAAGASGDGGAVREFARRQAEWAEEVSDYAAAADMYVQARRWDKAVALLGEIGDRDKLAEVMRALGEGDAEALRACAGHFARWGDVARAREAYGKLGDHVGLLDVFVQCEQWDDAFAICRAKPALEDRVYLPYAAWLADRDRFDEARGAYQRAGKAELSRRMLEQLTRNAVLERRFRDAGYCYWLLADEIASSLKGKKRDSLSDAERDDLARFEEHKDRAEMYYAYHLVHRAMNEPFRTSLPTTLLNVGQFLLAKFASRDEMPPGVSLAYVLITLATHGETLRAHKLVRFAYDKLQSLRVPKQYAQKVDLACVLSRAKPFTDAEELLPMCFRCASTNPLVSGKGDACVTCGGRFVRSFVTFEHLPLVEFEVAADISKKEARRLIEEEPPRAETKRGGGGGGDVLGGDQKMFFDDGENPADAMLNLEDPFTRQMAETHAPIVCDREMLRALPPEDVVIKPSGCSPLPPRYFRVMDPDAPIAVDEAGNAYEADEYELACLERGRTPFTRKPVSANTEMASAPPPEPDTPPAKAESQGWRVARGVAAAQKMDLAGAAEAPKAVPGGARARSRRAAPSS